MSIFNLNSLNMDTLNLQMMICGNNIRKTLQILWKLFLRLATLWSSVTYKPSSITKMYGLKKTNKSLLHSLCTIHYEEDQMEWTKEQILNYIRTSRLFASFKLNRISGLIDDLFNQICPTDPSNFRINFMGQSIPSTQVTDHNTPANQNMDQNISII